MKDKKMADATKIDRYRCICATVLCSLFLYREEVAVIVIIASSISLGVYP